MEWDSHWTMIVNQSWASSPGDLPNFECGWWKIWQSGSAMQRHLRVSGHDPGEVRPDHHRGDLEEELVDVALAREPSVVARLKQRLGEFQEPALLHLHYPVAAALRAEGAVTPGMQTLD
jgi:hypothetical protein